MPTTWDETMFIDGYPGRYAVVARRHAGKWYIAGVSNDEATRKLVLSLPMLSKGQEVTLYADDAKGKPLTATKLKIKNPEAVKLDVKPDGGFVIV